MESKLESNIEKVNNICASNGTEDSPWSPEESDIRRNQLEENECNNIEPSQTDKSVNDIGTSIPSSDKVPYRTKLLICIDSNRKFLNTKMFWKLAGTTWKFCEKIHQVTRVFNNERFKVLEAVLISCGVDDIDTKSGSDVSDELVETIKQIKQKYSSIKIIVSEVTPRNDARDGEVHKCNKKVRNSLQGLDDVYLVEQSNLRDANWSMFHDTKHIKKNCIPKFASNLKKGLHKAYGMERPRRMVRRNSTSRFSRFPDTRRSYHRQISNGEVNKNPLESRLTETDDDHEDDDADSYSDIKKEILNKIANAIKDL